MEDGQKIDHFAPIGPELSTVGSDGFGFGSKGDFLELTIPVPIEVEVAVKPPDGLLGAEGSIETHPGEHGFGHRGVHHLAFAELLNDVLVGVSEFEGVEGGSLRSGFQRGLWIAVFRAGFLSWGMVGA